MSYEIRLPSITGHGEQAQQQIKSYLFQLAEQLQFILNNIEVSSGYVTSTPTKSKSESEKTVIDEEATFNAIKSLIIKSADIVNAYYAEFSKRFDGKYVASSDFGVYSENTAQTIKENSTAVENLFINVQEILSEIESIEYTLADVNAHIRSGLLYYDEGGIPVYGLEIGQKNIIDGEEVFSKYARFTADRLSLYDQNDTEVAYISDYKLYIRNVEITSAYTIGRFVNKVMPNGDVVTKWVGIGGDG